jgi:propanol-preferring alcohol dehydrogenase
MKAALVREFKMPLEIVELDPPEPAPDEALIKVEACGVCHSDLHISEGDWPQLKRFIKQPLIPGHEVVGRVVKLGGSVSEKIKPGDRVGVSWVHWTCGECEFCKEGNENLCSSQSITGATVDGGYAEFMKAKASHVITVPDELSSHEAAPLFCAGVTVFRAMKNGGIRDGQRVAVFGVGGLGHLAIQIAKTLGAEVTAIDVVEDKLELAREVGADHTLNAATEDIPKMFRSRGGLHAAVVTSAAKAAYDQAFYSVRPSGSLVVVGMPSEPLSFPAIMMREIRITSAATGTRKDQKEVLELAAQGKLRCRVETTKLEAINDIFDQMRRGQITGRMVVTF